MTDPRIDALGDEMRAAGVTIYLNILELGKSRERKLLAPQKCALGLCQI